MMDTRALDTRAWRSFDVQDADGRTVAGIAVPYGKRSDVIYQRGQVFVEQFEPGAFRDSIGKRGARVQFLNAHDEGALPLGRINKLEERRDGLFIEARISDTSTGNDILNLVKDGAYDGFSIGFSVPRGGDAWSSEGGMQHRTVSRANLAEVSICGVPAYREAQVESVRMATEQAELEQLEAEARALVEAQQQQMNLRLELLRRRIA